MNKSFTQSISLRLAASIPSLTSLNWLRKQYGIQLSARQLKRMSDTIRSIRQSNVLIFGLGNDSDYWLAINQQGSTVFVEDNPGWFEFCTWRNPAIEAVLIEYGTTLGEWEGLLHSPSQLWLDLPESVRGRKWDIIIVDAPGGWREDLPGRMKSIFMASQIVSENGHIFVHDCEREIEAHYCDTYLGSSNLVSEIRGEGTIGDLRHYQL